MRVLRTVLVLLVVCCSLPLARGATAPADRPLLVLAYHEIAVPSEALVP